MPASSSAPTSSCWNARRVSGTRLADWHRRVIERPSVAACARAAAAVGFDSAAVSLEAVRQAMEQGLFKREYRDHRLEWMVKTGGLAVVQQGLERQELRVVVFVLLELPFAGRRVWLAPDVGALLIMWVVAARQIVSHRAPPGIGRAGRFRGAEIHQVR